MKPVRTERTERTGRTERTERTDRTGRTGRTGPCCCRAVVLTNRGVWRSHSQLQEHHCRCVALLLLMIRLKVPIFLSLPLIVKVFKITLIPVQELPNINIYII